MRRTSPLSSGGRTDVRRHQENERHAKLAKSKGSTKGGLVCHLGESRPIKMLAFVIIPIYPLLPAIARVF